MYHSKQPAAQSSFAEMFKELELSGSYDIEQAKIDIAEHIAIAMRQQQVSKAELARRLSKSRAYVTKVLQSGANFTIESLVKIAAALDCSIDVKLIPKHSKSQAHNNFWQTLNQAGRQDYLPEDVESHDSLAA